jgi:REP-associated tyrosine transposase
MRTPVSVSLRNMARSRYRFADARTPHFMTSTVVGWLPVFTRPSAVQEVFESWRFLQERGELEIHGYVVLENHFHLIASGPDLAAAVSRFRSYTARRILDLLVAAGARRLLGQLAEEKARHKADRPYQLWQEGMHPQEMRSEAMMRQKLEYVHANPVRRGYVDDPVQWRYSSARDYAGVPGLVAVNAGWW